MQDNAQPHLPRCLRIAGHLPLTTHPFLTAGAAGSSFPGEPCPLQCLVRERLSTSEPRDVSALGIVSLIDNLKYKITNKPLTWQGPHQPRWIDA